MPVQSKKNYLHDNQSILVSEQKGGNKLIIYL